jgi:hypothetical protein
LLLWFQSIIRTLGGLNLQSHPTLKRHRSLSSCVREKDQNTFYQFLCSQVNTSLGNAPNSLIPDSYNSLLSDYYYYFNCFFNPKMSSWLYVLVKTMTSLGTDRWKQGLIYFTESMGNRDNAPLSSKFSFLTYLRLFQPTLLFN